MKRIPVLAVLPLACAMMIMIGVATPTPLWACACGCNVFDVGTSAMFPAHPGGMAFLEYDYQNQNRNWSGTAPSSADNNSDKNILTNFFTLGYQYLFNRQWGVVAELPFSDRTFKTTDANGDIVRFEHSAVGDIRLKGLYTGLSPDMSTGLFLGVKLPSGDYAYPNFDPDTELGSGSTDLLLGAYQRGRIPSFSRWGWFLDGQLDQTVLHSGGYRPGSQFDAAAGVNYERWKIGNVKVTPLAQVIESYRWRDGGAFGHSQDSGYERILVAPGVEFGLYHLKIYTDVGFPVLQNVNGQQLVASELFKLNISYHF